VLASRRPSLTENICRDTGGTDALNSRKGTGLQKTKSLIHKRGETSAVRRTFHSSLEEPSGNRGGSHWGGGDDVGFESATKSHRYSMGGVLGELRLEQGRSVRGNCSRLGWLAALARLGT